ncbi:T9SS type A sorting domain-containing protein [Dyadobacter tibetensis]|uniref:T9SS type A sorting domain-containing protein n=1 Tax=Dyadobacter tibetensis TaxID=1211851 RepID=UPI00046F2A48|nr:T9SS type A sorting domain-containing protein [Dyadobacter tibetensis]
MKYKYYKLTSFALILGIALSGTRIMAQQCGFGPAYTCGGTQRYENYGLNSDNIAAEIEYDNYISAFHSTSVRTPTGTFKVWGESMSATGGDLASPTEINSTNYPGLTGQILKLAMGGKNWYNEVQSVLLTTDGLFAWGDQGRMLPSALTTSKSFQRISVQGKADGLPPGVSPLQVRMLFGTGLNLILTTCDGNVWVLTNGYADITGTGISNFSSSTGSNPRDKWYRVTTAEPGNPPLSKIIVARGTGTNTVMALDSDGNLWTWGYHTFLGNGTSKGNDKTRAVKMQLPSSGTIKMIGMTAYYNSSTGYMPTYYVLYTDGRLFSLGSNARRQLGNWPSTTPGSSTVSTTWIQPRYNSSTGPVMDDIHWISPNEHVTTWFDPADNDYYYSYAAINVLSKAGLLYNWGDNDGGMLGRVPKEGYLDPGQPQPSANGIYTPTTDKVVAVETGGHTTMMLKQCMNTYGYTGHRVGGSMGDGGSLPEGWENIFTFNTAGFEVCGANTDISLTPSSEFICQGTPFSVWASPVGGTWAVTSGNATYSTVNNNFSITGPGDITIEYTAPNGCQIKSKSITLPQRDFGNLDPLVYKIGSASIKATNSAWLGQNAGFPTSDCATNIADTKDGLAIFSGVIPVAGDGSSGSPFELNGGMTYNFQVTVNGNTTIKPVYWAVWYDLDGNGSFIDAGDIFQSGVLNHGSPQSTTFPVTLPASVSPDGAIRVVGTATNLPFTKAMNGEFFVENGEVEDYYVKMTPLPVKLIAFEAKAENQITNLSWSTSEEVNSERFQIEHSMDGKKWNPIGSVDSKGSGNNVERYAYQHSNPVQGTNLYRMKMIDLDQTFTYSRIVSVKIDEILQKGFLYPNPSTNMVWIGEIDLTKVTKVQILNTNGKVVLETSSVDANGIPVNSLTNGVYVLNASIENGGIKTFKIVINR